MIRFTLSQLAAIAHGERQGSDVAIDEVTTDTGIGGHLVDSDIATLPFAMGDRGKLT